MLTAYELRVLTSDLKGAATSARVRVCLRGDEGVGGDALLHGALGERVLERGGAATFIVRLPFVGELTAVELLLEGGRGAWHLHALEVRHLASGRGWRCAVDSWIGAASFGRSYGARQLTPTEAWDEPAGGERLPDSAASFVEPTPLFAVDAGAVVGPPVRSSPRNAEFTPRASPRVGGATPRARV
eukprot:3748474-Prymnesium_polylepis.1